MYATTGEAIATLLNQQRHHFEVKCDVKDF